MGETSTFFETVVLALNSRDCSSGSPYGGQCSFTISQQGLNDVVNVRVKQFNCENSFYNVESTDGGGKNWDLWIYFFGDVNGSSFFQIPAGCYGITDLLQAIVTGFASYGDTVTATYSTVTQKITITLTAGVDSTIQIDYAAAFVAGKTYALNRLGFLVPAAASTTITADQAYVLLLTDSLLLKSNALSSIRSLVSTQGPPAGIIRDAVIYQVAITSNSWNAIFNQIPSAWFNLSDVGHLGALDFNLTDDKGYPITLQQKGYSVMLEFQCKKGTY
jgi:hypothetical protein